MDIRNAELAKYESVYQIPEYRMGDARKKNAIYDMAPFVAGSKYLDIGCGRGEMLDYARSIRVAAIGTEVVDALCLRDDVVFSYAHRLPFDQHQFDYVTMFDVLEHLIEGDEIEALKEVRRVCSKYAVLTANNEHSYHPTNGSELHINIRSYQEWDAMVRGVFAGHSVKRLHRPNSSSITWRINFK